jgi:uncharacterized membrane protein
MLRGNARLSFVGAYWGRSKRHYLFLVHPASTKLLTVHTALGIIALASGAWNLSATKGTARHRLVGWVYAGSMFRLIGTSFGIFEVFSGFGPFHVMSIVSGGTLALALYFPHRRAHYEDCSSTTTCGSRGRTSDWSWRLGPISFSTDSRSGPFGHGQCYTGACRVAPAPLSSLAGGTRCSDSSARRKRSRPPQNRKPPRSQALIVVRQ